MTAKFCISVLQLQISSIRRMQILVPWINQLPPASLNDSLYVWYAGEETSTILLHLYIFNYITTQAFPIDFPAKHHFCQVTTETYFIDIASTLSKQQISRNGIICTGSSIEIFIVSHLSNAKNEQSEKLPQFTVITWSNKITNSKLLYTIRWPAHYLMTQNRKLG